jgi:hypothetical protein
MQAGSPDRVDRRLAAILAADVAGYSRLIGADEEGTLARLKAVYAKLIDPAIAAHHGRIVKTTGDGLLAEFASTVDALRCASEIQAGMTDQTRAPALRPASNIASASMPETSSTTAISLAVGQSGPICGSIVGVRRTAVFGASRPSTGVPRRSLHRTIAAAQPGLPEPPFMPHCRHS